MDARSKQSKRRDDVLSSLNVVIEGLNIAQNLSSITPAKAVFSTVSVILTMIRDSMINEDDYVDLGLTCNTVCTALDRGLKGKRLNELGGSVLEAIGQLTTTVADIRSKVTERSKQNGISRAFHAKNDSQAIVSWRTDLNRILLVFNTELGLNIYVAISDVRDGVTNTHAVVADTHTVVAEVRQDVASTRAIVSDISRKILGSPEGDVDRRRPVSDTQTRTVPTKKHMLTAAQTQTSALGESPPPAPRACFGRDGLIEKIVSLAENLTPTALIGPGGIGKTSIALAVLHHDRIKQRFCGNRRFIRCDQFPASCAHLLSRLSKAIGAGVENPESLASLHPVLSSGEVFIVLDNAESILDPQGTDAREIYSVVEELSRLDNVYLCITSRISTIPSDCETLDVPTLSIDAARDAFYRIYKNAGRSGLVDNILGQLDFHPLSITLLATVAHQSKWSTDRLAREWKRQRTRMLQTMHNKSFAATIELSLASPMFQELGPDARALLEVVAFFPQGVDEDNLKWLFPSISNGANIFDKFCILSLAYRSNTFITMLAPLRDHLRPKNPKSSPLLCATKECYFTRMSVSLNPNKPGFEESRWITSEDMNVEHLLDVFTTIDVNSESVWDACTDFMRHLARHKNRLTVLRPKIEGLPDGHPSKPRCLFELSWLFRLVGNHVERERLLAHTLKLQRERGDDRGVARTLRHISRANRHTGLNKEGVQLVGEASGILERLGDTVGQARCLKDLAWSLYSNKQFDAAEEAATRAIDLLTEKGEQAHVCESHRVLGHIYRSKGDTEKAVYHLEAALEVASSFNWDDELFLAHHGLAGLFLEEGRFEDAQVHVERARLRASNHTYSLGRAMEVQAELWYKQDRVEGAKFEALRAVDVYEKLGAAKDLKRCRVFLQRIGEETSKPATPDQSADDERVIESK